MNKKPLRHFTLVLGRIEHVSLAMLPWTFCGRPVGHHPRRPGLTCKEAKRRAKCKVCKRCLRP